MAGYNVNSKIPFAFLYTNNDSEEKEIKESMPFKIVLINIKCLEINLPNEVKDLYQENFKTIKKLNKILGNEKALHAVDWKNQYCQNAIPS